MLGQHEDRAFAVHVRLFTVLADIHAETFLAAVGTQRHDDADELEQDEAARRRCKRIAAPTATAWIPSCAGLPKSRPSATPFHAFSAKTPVSSAPTVPPTPCAATTSSESSRRVRARHSSA